jgi:hypothetical protein
MAELITYVTVRWHESAIAGYHSGQDDGSSYPFPKRSQECPRGRTMVSQRDKSGDPFALTTRSRNCLSSSCSLALSPRLHLIQKNRLPTGTAARANRPVRQFRSEPGFAHSWREKSVNAQVCVSAADGAASEPCEPWAHSFQVQPNEQPSAEGFGGEAA